jgi:hypothetical protein
MNRPSAIAALLVAACLTGCGVIRDKSATADADSAPRDSVVFVPPAVTVDSTVPWSRIAELINDGTRNIRLVRQSHSRAVSVVMKDGRVFRSTEPQFDAIVRLIHGVDQSNSTPIVTE